MAQNIQNRFLRSFRPEQLDRLAPIEPVEFGPNRLIYRQNEPISHVIFMESGLVSGLRHVSGKASPVEMLVTGGLAGVVGAHTVLHTPESFFEYRCRVAGNGWQISSAAIHAAMAQDVEINAHLQRVVRVANLLVAQTAACRMAHSIEQQLCRLVLCISDRLETDQLPLSRRTLAQMISISRGHTFVITKNLAGIITFRRGHLSIDDPIALRERACGCFEEMRVEREKLAAYP